MQTVLTVNEAESLVKLEAQHTKEMEELEQRCAQLEQDNTRLRAGTVRENNIKIMKTSSKVITKRPDSIQVSSTGTYC